MLWSRRKKRARKGGGREERGTEGRGTDGRLGRREGERAREGEGEREAGLSAGLNVVRNLHWVCESRLASHHHDSCRACLCASIADPVRV